MSLYLGILTPILVDFLPFCNKVNKRRRKTKVYFIKSTFGLRLEAIHTFIHSFIYAIVIYYFEFIMFKKMLWELSLCPYRTENWKIWKETLFLPSKTHLHLIKNYGK